MTLSDVTTYWQTTANDALSSAETLFEAKHFDHSLFFCHLALEKILKGLIWKKTGDPPLPVHDLVKLAQQAKLKMTTRQQEQLKEITTWNIEARYDTKTILSDKPHRLLKKYRSILIREGVPVDRMIIFGSYAKGNAKPWSDLDVCVISPILGKNIYNERVRLAKLTLGVDTIIEPHPYHPKDLENPYDPLAREIQTWGKQVD